MSLLAKLKYWWGDTPVPPEQDLPDNVITEVIEASDEPLQPSGGVRKLKHKLYTPDEHRHGGRVVKLMPKPLRHIKELQEHTDD